MWVSKTIIISIAHVTSVNWVREEGKETLRVYVMAERNPYALNLEHGKELIQALLDRHELQNPRK